MSNSKTRITDRVMALLLSLIMIIGLFPMSLTAYAVEIGEQFSITVKCDEQAVEGATVSYSVDVDETPTLSGSETTDDNGIIFVDLSSLEETITSSDVKLNYEVSAEGYDTESGSVTFLEVADLTQNVDVVLTESTPETAQVTVSVTGNATVKLNDEVQNSVVVEKGSDVKVEIIPAEGSYIKELTVGEDSKSVTKGKAYTETLTVNDALNISATVMEEYTVTVNNAGNGTVKLGGNKVESVTVDKNTELALEVTADEGYYISSVDIGAAGQTISEPASFTTTVKVESDTVISVEFVKVYKIEVSANANGEVKITDPDTAGGSVVVNTGTSVTVKATPNTNYRVSEVLINTVADQTVQGINDEDYEYTFDADKDYSFIVTFAPNQYSVSINNPDHGSASVSSELVDHGGKAIVYWTPDKNYDIEDIIVNGTSMLESATDGSLEITVTKATEVVVSFGKVDITDASGLLETEGYKISFKKDNQEITPLLTYTDADDNVVVVFPSGTKALLEPKGSNYEIKYNDTDPQWGYSSSVTISNTTLIKNIYVKRGTSRNKKTNYTVNVRFVIDSAKPTATITPASANANGYYNSDVTVDIKAEDPSYHSGIASVDYWVTSNGVTTVSSTNLYTYDAASDPEQKSVRTTYNDRITVVAANNNSDNVVVNVKVTDRAGCYETYTKTLKINATKPTISVTMESDSIHDEASSGYYNATRTAYVTFTDRASCFNKTAAEACIKITATNAQGQTVVKPTRITWAENGDTHQATVEFLSDANYSWSIYQYTNKADLKNEGIFSETGTSIYNFTVDTHAPTGSVKIDDLNTWNKLISTLTFGIWRKSDSVIATANGVTDATSTEPTVHYYKSNSDAKLSEEELEAHYKDGDFGTEPITVNSDEKFVVYVRLTDKAGNHAYISTNGIVYDKTQSAITITPAVANKHGYHNSDVKVDISVNEDVNDVAAYSGIKTIDYVVIKDGDEANPTQSGNLYTFPTSNPTYAQLKSEWSGQITVNSAKNNSNDVVVIVKVVDNAGNEYSNQAPLSINVNKPTAKLTFQDNPQNTIEGRGYYNNKRVATLVITDREDTFDSSLVEFDVNAKDSKGQTVDSPYSVGAWTNVGNTHTVEITFEKDANYDWSFSYTNKADKAVVFNEVNVGTSKTPYKFTVDTTDPTGKVSVTPNTWDQLLNFLTFGLWSKVKVDVTASAEDATSPYIIEYYKDNGSSILTPEQLDAKTFKKFEPFSIDSDEQFTVYLKVTDMANNYSYISSDGNIVDMKASAIELTPDEPNENKVYNEDVDVAIKVTDAAPYSGIKTIDYTVVKDGDTEHPTQSGNLYTFAPQATPTQADLKEIWTGSITVDSELNNSSNVVVTITTVDNAGNEKSEYVTLDIDITKPVIEVTFDNNKDNAAATGYDGKGYFDADRTATVVITERTNHFDGSAATEKILITAKDAKGIDVTDAYTISGWTTVEGSTPDEATHTATIHFIKDANYTFGISYKDKADNQNDGVDVKTSVAPFTFTVDTVNPVGTVTAKNGESTRETTWDKLNNDLTFGFWSKQKISLSGAFDDATSSAAKVEYYKVVAKNANDGTTALTKEQLDAVTSWSKFTGFDVLANEQFTVYIKITDNAGNYAYISTDGLIVDDQAPIEETIAPEITVKPEQPINGIYNKDVKVSIKVNDPLVGGTYSGLQKIEYKVLNMGVETQSGTLYEFTVKNPKQSDLLQTWTGEITVDSTLNNSNDVVIEVYAVDNSLNSSKDNVSIKIDITAPTIDISYNNNDVDSGKYFKADRTATIVVTERNFKADDVKIVITNTDKIIPSITEWTKVDGTGNLDDTKWTTMVTYNADGDYTFAISYTDLAGNACEGANYGESVQPTEFTIDKTIPVINVSYDNNNALNTNYYKEARTSTIVITEHNFNTDRIKITLTATDDGKEIAAPTVSKWATNGDTHTATIAYSADALYNFDIEYSDLAGNNAADFEKQTFYVDKTAPSLEITGVKNESANNGDVIPVITYSDTNFDLDNVTITLVGANRKVVTLDGSKSEIHNGQVFTFKNFAKEKEVDDIYTLTAKLTDKAGNSTEQTIVFSVNRFGSTYEMNSETKALNGTYVQKPVDVVVTETNANELKNIKITLFKNNETITLKEGADYKVDVEGGNGSWYHYTYTVFAKNFADDGVYRLTFHSEDSAGNVAENTLDTKDTEVSFGVDATKPNIVVENLENGVTYALENMTVNMSISDNLLLDSITVYLDDYNTPYKTWTAEEIAAIVAENGEFTFDIAGDSTNAHKVKIVTVDAAGNEQVEEITNFFVTTNLWVRYYNNKGLFFGSIGGVVAIAGLIIFLILAKRKKEDK